MPNAGRPCCWDRVLQELIAILLCKNYCNKYYNTFPTKYCYFLLQYFFTSIANNSVAMAKRLRVRCYHECYINVIAFNRGRHILVRVLDDDEVATLWSQDTSTCTTLRRYDVVRVLCDTRNRLDQVRCDICTTYMYKDLTTRNRLVYRPIMHTITKHLLIW